VLALASLLTACKPVGPDYSRPAYQPPAIYKETGAAAVQAPPAPAGGGQWQPASPSDGLLQGSWWQIYQDAQLSQLEERVAQANPTLRQAAEAYLAARDQAAAARSALFPTVSVGLSGERYRVSKTGASYSASKGATNTDLQIAGQAAWEPDFWGQVRRSIESANAGAQALAAQQAVVSLSLHAELAADYFALRGVDAQARMLSSTVADLEHQLDLTQRRMAGGVATAADVAQAQTQLETVRAQLTDLGQSRAQFEHALATLIGVTPSELTLAPAPLDLALPRVPTGVPSQLLERRPDIAAAERLTAEANAKIGIARAAFYPSIGLSSAVGFETIHPGTWIQGPSALWSLGASATQLLFDAGRRRALSSAAQHQYEAQASSYRATVLAAFAEVEDALATLRILEHESQIQDKAVASAQHSYDLAKQRYQGGVTGYLEVLTAEQALLQNQRTQIDLRTRQFQASVSLVRALGGGWDATQLPK
jgi:NodT family efflux transporter outer membrane factor (OMF) lipoprotein